MIYVSRGNLRMKCTIFNIQEVVNCPVTTELCRKYCYAKKASRLYPQVTPSRINNYHETLKESFVHDMIDILKRKRNPLVRIHESGGFYSQEYFNKWIQICKSLPDKRFLAFTQAYDLDISDIPDNFKLYWSIWDDSVNIPTEGNFAYVLDNGKWSNLSECNVSDRDKLYICGKGHNYKTCNECLICWNGSSNVGFELH